MKCFTFILFRTRAPPPVHEDSVTPFIKMGAQPPLSTWGCHHESHYSRTLPSALIRRVLAVSRPVPKLAATSTLGATHEKPSAPPLRSRMTASEGCAVAIEGWSVVWHRWYRSLSESLAGSLGVVTASRCALSKITTVQLLLVEVVPHLAVVRKDSHGFVFGEYHAVRKVSRHVHDLRVVLLL